MNRKFFEEGRAACIDGKGVSDNPHTKGPEPGIIDAYEWHKGYKSALPGKKDPELTTRMPASMLRELDALRALHAAIKNCKGEASSDARIDAALARIEREKKHYSVKELCEIVGL